MSLPNAPKKYLVGGILVEAVKSEGGGFYELTVVATGDKQRYLADVFESVAKPYIQVSNDPSKASYVSDCGGCDMCQKLENGGGDK